MKEFILRDYQRNQINFIRDRMDIVNIMGICSPTGSGKTITFLSYVKEWLEKPENHLTNVVISTGFNNLVFLLEERAKEMGLDTKILIGTKACNCPEEMKKAGLPFKVFTKEPYRCQGETLKNHKSLDLRDVPENAKVCQWTQRAYEEHYQSIVNGVGQVIITNHSSLLVHQKSLQNTSLLIVDEAHTFSNFYDSYVRLELDRNDLMQIDKAISSIKEPMRSIIKMNIKRGVDLPPLQVDAICNAIRLGSLRSATREFFETKASYSNFIERTPNYFSIDRFYKYFDLSLKCKTILFSATLDKFTLNMFNVNKSNVYNENKTFVDYSQSEFIAIPRDDYAKALTEFLNYVNERDLQSGLILSTTIHDMNIALKMDGLHGFKFFDNLNEFSKCNGKKILVGSRSLFQGVDIPNLSFVCLNKIPFPNYDEKMQSLQNFLTDKGKNNFDPWMDYTVPKTENDIIQSLGRLWRSVDSKGIVSIFDPRVEKFKYMIKHAIYYHRYGININIMRENGAIEPFNVK